MSKKDTNQYCVGGNGEIIKMPNLKFHFYIYILIKDLNPIYVGSTTDIKQRIASHKCTKEFDSYIIASKCYSAPQANASEQTLIATLKYFYPDLMNKKNCKLYTDI